MDDTRRVSCRTGQRDHQYDETVAVSSPAHRGISTDQQVVELVPLSGRCAGHDQTVVWSKPVSRHPIRIVARVASYRKRLGSKGSAVVWIGLVMLMIAGMIGTICQAGKSDREGVMPPVPVRKEAPVSAPVSPESSSVIAHDFTTAATPVPSSKMAADALVEGRLDEALQRYGELKARHPRNRSYALIVDILSASEKRRTP